MSDTQKRVISVEKFYGGESSDRAVGPTASFGMSQALEFRHDPSRLTVLPGPRKISNGVVQDLILNMVQVQNGNRYAFGDQGYLYKIDTNNAVTYFNKLSDGTDGLLYRADTDALYAATATTLQRFYPMSGTPTNDVSYGPTRSTYSDSYRTGGTLTYTVPTTLQEGEACYFSTDIEPFYSIKVNTVAVGTGDWTLTLHDGLNNVLATSTIIAANIRTGLNEFVFSSQVRAIVNTTGRTGGGGQNYHFHLTSTVGGGTVACSTASDLDTADFELWAYRFVDTANGLHPIAQFQQFIIIGNGNYLAVWEPLTSGSPPNNEFLRHRLVFPPGFEVCGIAVTDEFAVIACEKRSTDGTRDFQEGKLFTWDGTALTYNQVIDVSGGSPQGIYSFENFPYFLVNGALCAWAGGKNIIKVRTIANTSTAYRDTVDNTNVYPNMMTVRDNILHLGYPSYTSNTAIKHGVYTWGSVDKDYQSSFGYSYLISTQTNLNTNGTLQLGMVRNFGDEMYISWKDGTAYGLDIVDSYCNPAPVYKFRALEFNARARFKDKQATRMGVFTEELPTGTTITPVHSIDGGADVTHTPMTSGTEAIVSIQEGTFKSIVYGFDGTCEGTAPPVILANALEWDSLATRKAF